MKENDLITRRDVELALLEKGQRSRRYKLGDIWELNYDEIRDALSEYQQKIVRCEDCKFAEKQVCRPKEYEYKCTLLEFEGLCDYHGRDWFCAGGERR